MTLERAPGSRPNIVLFVADELRADALACYGNPVVQTPNFDRLASEGVLFEDCHVQFPVCAASRCSLLTGWPASTRGHRSLYHLLRPDEPNLFRYLRQAGYDVFWFGRNDALASQTFHDSVTRWSNVRPDSLNYTPDHAPEAPQAITFLSQATGDRRQSWDYRMLQEAFAVLGRREPQRPFCIFLPLFQPHPPYGAPDGFHDLYRPQDVPSLAPPDLPGKPDFHPALRASYGLDAVSETTFRRIRAIYQGQVSYCDWLLGELLAALERTGHVDDTALFAFADHGDYAGDYGLVEKWPSGLEDALTHVPLIVRAPGGQAGRRVINVVELFDVMATCLDLAGVEARHTHFARSLTPQLHGDAGDPERAAFAEGGYNTFEPQCFEPADQAAGVYAEKLLLQNRLPSIVARSAMIRTRTHKLVMRSTGGCELYEIGGDALEQRNRFGDPQMAAIQGDLQARLLARYIDTSGVTPTDRDPRGLPPYHALPAFPNAPEAGAAPPR
ncbi:MAG TPA: sulfatase-like hydrolase/transferase [Caulobacteraceae bacterium]|jgi:choline-sulfatase